MRLLLTGLALLLLVAGGCGGDSGDSGFTNDDISTALGLRFDGPDMVYDLPSGQECMVIKCSYGVGGGHLGPGQR